jgi:transcriptional regulator with XRE-family HTH domain
MSIENSKENVKIALAIRTARAAIGWNQQEFAELMGVAKSTVARIETLEMSAKADFLNKAMRLFRDAGVVVDLYELDRLPLTINKECIEIAQQRLADESLRRRDRRTGIASLLDIDD